MLLDSNLENIKVVHLSTFDVEGGSVLHAIKKDDDIGYNGTGRSLLFLHKPKCHKKHGSCING